MGVCHSKPKQRDMSIQEPTNLPTNTEQNSLPKLKARETISQSKSPVNASAQLQKPRSRTYGSKPQIETPKRLDKYTVNGEMVESLLIQPQPIVSNSESVMNLNDDGKNLSQQTKSRNRKSAAGFSVQNKLKSVSIGNSRSQSIGSKKELQVSLKEIEIEAQKQSQGFSKFKPPLKTSFQSESGKRIPHQNSKPPLINKGFSLNYTFLEAMQTGTDIKYAKYQENQTKLIKEVKCIKKLSQEQIQSVLKEIQDLVTLDHPNIMGGLDFYEDEKYFYIVHEVCSLGDLSTFIQQRKINDSVVKSIMFQILKLLNYIHKQNKVLLSLSSRKIYLTGTPDNPIVKLIDLEDLTDIGQVNKQVQEREKNIFHAPELSDSQHYKSSDKYDIWSAGVIFYHILVRDIPNTHRHQIQLSNDKNLAEASQDMLALLQDLLNSKKNSRPSAQTALNSSYFKSIRSSVLAEEQNKALKSMVSFKDADLLQQSAIMFMLNNFATYETQDLLRRLYYSFDLSNEGGITIDHITKLFHNQVLYDGPAVNIQSLFKSLDLNCDGRLDFLEFALAAVDKTQMLTKSNIGKTSDAMIKKGLKATTKTTAIQRFIRATPYYSLKIDDENDDILQVDKLSKRDFSSQLMCLVKKD